MPAVNSNGMNMSAMTRQRPGADARKLHRDVIGGEPFTRRSGVAALEPIGGKKFDRPRAFATRLPSAARDGRGKRQNTE